jgi:hypothetical protein
MTRRATKLVREGSLAAEVDVALLDGPGEWGPYLSPEDAMRLDMVRALLQSGDTAQAARYGRIFELKPIPA